MLLLACCIIPDCLNMALADAKRAISILPCKWVQRTIVLIDPLGTVGLDHTNCIAQRHRSVLDIENVYMVGRSANLDTRTFVVVKDFSNIGMNLLEMSLGYSVGTTFGRENEMDVDFG